MAEQIVKYQANDGVEVTLSPKTVAAYIATGNAQADMADVMRFMATCRARGLNPLAGDAHMTVYQNRDGKKSVSTVVSKDYFVRTACADERYEGLRAGVVVTDADGQVERREGGIVLDGETLVGGWAEVEVKGRKHPSRVEVSMREYDLHRSLWNSKPATMIRKVALVQALREAFPAKFGGVYDGDEVGMPEPPQPEPVQAVETTPAPDAPLPEVPAEEEF